MDVIFAKTPKGLAAIEQRTGGLTPRIRRVLIFVDGKRTVEDLRTMLQADDLQHTLGMLEENGFIELARAVQRAGQAPQSTPVPLPAITAFRALPAEADPLQFQMARNFMTNTLNVFVGSVGATSLLERIEQATNHGTLRELFDEWFHAIVMSRDGRREAEGLRTKLLAVI